MCLDCLKERMPDRGSTCLDGGAYLLNYVGCHQCKQKGFLAEKEKVREEDEDELEEELVTYKHVCEDCGHVVAVHKYSFSADDQFQDYSMQCNLCGHGESTVSILPDDPREKPFF